MTIPAYTVYANRPRLFCRDTDKTAITARTDDAGGWKPKWDATIIPAANTYKGYTDAQVVAIANPHQRMMVLALAGWIEETGRPVGGYKDKAIDAAFYLSDLADGDPPLNKRARLLALAIAFDFLHADMTSSERDAISAEMFQQSDRMSFSLSEQIDGHSGNDQMCNLLASLTGHGHGTLNWDAHIGEALEFWYGLGEIDGRLKTPQYFKTDGGLFKGGWYSALGLWGELWLMMALKNGTTALDPWTAEASWAGKIWEGILWSWWTGGSDDDFEAHGDTAKLTAPKFQNEMRWALAQLATQYPTPDSTEGGKHLRWLYDQWDALDSDYADNLIFDVILLDKGSVAAVAPKSAASAISTSRLFDPPGLYHFRKAASTGDDWEPDDAVTFRVGGRKWYDGPGHRHLDAGGLQASFKGDRILLAPAGIYDSFASLHHENAYQRSWLQSLVPLIVDAGQVFQRWSVVVANDGGQHYKKYDGASDPETVWKMQNDGGGEAWKRCAQFEKVTDTGSIAFVVVDMLPAYIKELGDQNRATVIKSKFLFIRPNANNALTYPACLWFCRVTKVDQTAAVIIPLHSAAAWTAQSYGFTTLGSRSEGKLWLDIKNKADFTITNQTPGSPLDALGYGPDQFKVPGGSVNYKPARAVKTREAPDLKKHSLYWQKTAHLQTEDFVACLLVSGSGDAEPASSRAWASEVTYPDFHGVTIGTETYLIHKTQDVVSVGSPDSTPPAEVTSLALTARDSALLSEWTDPVDSDLEKLIVKIRTSAIP